MKTFWTLLLTCSFVVGAACSVDAQEKKAKTPEEQFAAMDKDGDKMVSESEFVGKKEGDKAEAAKKRFKKVDANSDGKVSFEEFKASMKKAK